MPFTGKATYTSGATLPEAVEDVSDLIAINSPHETPLLDALGDPARFARSTIHEWLEDQLLPNTDTIVSASGADIEVNNPTRFRVGDQVRLVGGTEVMLVSAVSDDDATITVVRNYGGTASSTLSTGATLSILGNAALEGDDAATVRFTARNRLRNYTQIFSSSVEVSGSELAVRQIGLRDELDYQKNQRTRELLRDLENSVINGVSASSNPQGATSVRRTMRGLNSFISTNRFVPGSGIPSGTALSEEQLNTALKTIWKSSAGNVDLIVVGGTQKRAINQFVTSNQRVMDRENFKAVVNIYESDYGVCRVVLSRYVPTGVVFLLDSSRIEIVPLTGRSFHYKPLAVTGDKEEGMVVGEYTMEFRNENAHGVISGLAA